jgi:predicted CXXCH cytochrome family protein
VENPDRARGTPAGPKPAQQQRLAIGVALFLFVVLQVWLAGFGQNVPVAVGQSLETNTPTPTGTPRYLATLRNLRTLRATRTPTPTTRVGSPTPTPTLPNTPTQRPTLTATVARTATPTPTFVSTPTGAPTLTPTPSPTYAPTDTPLANPTLTATLASTSTPTETSTGEATVTLTLTPGDTPTGTATLGVTSNPTDTLTATPIITDTLTPTATPIITDTLTPTVTPTLTPTMTPTPGITVTLELSASPSSAYVAPGGIVSYTVTILNGAEITATVGLTTTDSSPSSFTSSFEKDLFVIPPGKAAATFLTVSASSEAQGQVDDETVVRATVESVEYAETLVTTRLLYVEFNRALEGPATSDHFVSPDDSFQMHVGISASVPLTQTVLTEYVPAGWKVTDTGGGTLTAGDDQQTIEWKLRAVAGAVPVTRTYTVLSPPAVTPAPEYAFQTKANASGVRFFSPPWSVTLRHPLVLDHYRIGWDSPLNQMKYAARTDQPATKIPRFSAFRVRFQVVNDQLSPVQWQPRLEWGSKPTAAFQVIAVGQPKAGEPFYIRPVDDTANGERIPTQDFGTGGDTHAPQAGFAFTNQDPGPILTLTAFSFTEIEFSVRATADAEYLQNYYFRLSDDGRVMSGPLASIQMEPQPVLHLTQPQYHGISPNAPVAPRNKPNPKSKTNTNQALFYPHGPYTLTAAECETCHTSHTGISDSLLPDPPAQSNLCFTCHDGTNAITNIKSDYTDPNVPPNDPSTNSIYSHPATTPAANPAGGNDAFHNVLNRQSECGNCHNPHAGDSSLTTETAKGYLASGALAKISGVGVSGSSRSFVWEDSITYEYELCYKCHSSYTVLPTSPAETDQSAEFNPANASFHPIESSGTNSSTAMGNNLAGTSPYKLWNFGTGDTIRCLNCHGDYRLANPASPPAANGRLAPHSSEHVSLLMNNYRDLLLKPSGEAYQASDFALCYQCHAEAPFKDTTANVRSDTNFRYHGFHLNLISDVGSGGTDINTPGDGQGNAICRECHYQTHGQPASARGNASGTALVNFAPDVQPNSAQILQWDPSAQTCNLTCHGYDHVDAGY